MRCACNTARASCYVVSNTPAIDYGLRGGCGSALAICAAPRCSCASAVLSEQLCALAGPCVAVLRDGTCIT